METKLEKLENGKYKLTLTQKEVDNPISFGYVLDKMDLRKLQIQIREELDEKK
jgi:hypothetical protein